MFWEREEVIDWRKKTEDLGTNESGDGEIMSTFFCRCNRLCSFGFRVSTRFWNLAEGIFSNLAQRALAGSDSVTEWQDTLTYSSSQKYWLSLRSGVYACTTNCEMHFFIVCYYKVENTVLPKCCEIKISPKLDFRQKAHKNVWTRTHTYFWPYSVCWQQSVLKIMFPCN